MYVFSLNAIINYFRDINYREKYSYKNINEQKIYNIEQIVICYKQLYKLFKINTTGVNCTSLKGITNDYTTNLNFKYLYKRKKTLIIS